MDPCSPRGQSETPNCGGDSGVLLTVTRLREGPGRDHLCGEARGWTRRGCVDVDSRTEASVLEDDWGHPGPTIHSFLTPRTGRALGGPPTSLRGRSTGSGGTTLRPSRGDRPTPTHRAPGPPPAAPGPVSTPLSSGCPYRPPHPRLRPVHSRRLSPRPRHQPSLGEWHGRKGTRPGTCLPTRHPGEGVYR